MTDPQPEWVRPGSRAAAYQDIRKLQVSPKDTILELKRLLHTPLGQRTKLSAIIPVLKSQSNKKSQQEQEAAVSEIVGPATLQRLDDSLKPFPEPRYC